MSFNVANKIKQLRHMSLTNLSKSAQIGHFLAPPDYSDQVTSVKFVLIPSGTTPTRTSATKLVQAGSILTFG